ncbi:hypothetical protein PT974_05626 [Cladobotryum mycophilum]|uniref:Uncharacterized protein n=1 Tax=Cladobotryum mycophilum TaxID=491253 RepID=A0ABR0SKE4_9HYPO
MSSLESLEILIREQFEELKRPLSKYFPKDHSVAETCPDNHDMNRTESRLPRHSRLNSSKKDDTRQKRYFANARAGKHSSTSASSVKFVPSYITRTETQRGSNLVVSASQQYNEYLADFGHFSPYRGSAATAQTDDESSGALPLDGKRQRSPMAQRQASSGPSIVDLEAKRRKLLEKPDWAGVAYQKRSAGISSTKSRYVATSKDISENIPIIMYPNHNSYNIPHTRWRGSQMSTNSIPPEPRIEVSGQDFRWSVGSNSIRSLRRSNYPPVDPSEQPTPKAKLPHSNFPYTTYNSPESSLLSHQRIHRPKPSTVDTFRSSISARTIRERASISANVQSRGWSSTDPAEIAVISSLEKIYEPTPLRQQRIRFLDGLLSDTNLDNSIDSQASKPDVYSSHEGREESKWRHWVNSHEDPGMRESDSNIYNHQRTTRLPAPAISQTELNRTTLPKFQSAQRATSSFDTRPSYGDRLSKPRTVSPPSTNFPINRQTMSSKINTLTKTNQPVPDEEELREPIRRMHNHTLKMDVESRAIDVLPQRRISDNNGRGKGDQHHHIKGFPPMFNESVEEEVDEDEIWKQFVFDRNGSSAEIGKRALDDAHRETTRLLCPLPDSSSSAAAEPPSVSDQGSLEDLHNETSDVNEEFKESTNSVLAQPRSPTMKKPDEFRFRQPRQFIGRLAHPGAEEDLGLHRTASNVPTRSRRRKRDSRRPDIRALPDFEGDPIEESP